MKLVQLVQSVLLLGLVLCADAYLTDPIGYMEGTMRRVECDSGYIKGLEAWFRHADAVRGKCILALRIRCSSGKIKVQYEGGKAESDDRIFGYGDGKSLSVTCPQGKGITAIDWRQSKPAGTKEAEGVAKRVSGLKVFCGSETDPSPLVLDADPEAKTYDRTAKCSMVEGGPKGGTLTSIMVWYEHDFTGFHVDSCSSSV